MTQELAVINSGISVAQVMDRVRKVHELLERVLKPGIDRDYAKIPGTTEKLSLLKPGAEKILMMFQMSTQYAIQDLSTDLEARYRCTCTITGPEGQFVGSADAECSSFEDKFGWRGVKGDNEWNATPEESRRIKFDKNDQPIRQVRYDRAESAHKVMAMAQKRAMILATRTATACSDIFTQDIDADPEAEQKGERAPIAKPQAKAAPAPTTKHEPQEGEESVVTHIVSVGMKDGKNATTGKAWTKYVIETSQPDTYNTFDKKIAEAAEALQQIEGTARITFKASKFGKDVTAIEQVGDAAQ